MVAVRRPKQVRCSRLFSPKLINAERGPRYASVASEYSRRNLSPPKPLHSNTLFLPVSRNAIQIQGIQGRRKSAPAHQAIDVRDWADSVATVPSAAATTSTTPSSAVS